MNGLNDSTVLLDTNVLIYYFQDHPIYGRAIEYWLRHRRVAVSVVTVAEFLTKAQPEDLKPFELFLALVVVIPIDLELARVAAALRQQLLSRTSRTILLDCFIAATAISRGCRFATANRRDFPFRGLRFAKFRQS